MDHCTADSSVSCRYERLPGVVFVVAALLLFGALLAPRPSSSAQKPPAFEDDEACLLCHKYPKMARITDEGVKRTYYVMPEVFGATVHRNVSCSDCHDYIDQLPHREVATGVSCSNQCHSVQNPATGKDFSHRPIVDLYLKSTHGRPKVAIGDDRDKPYCVTCHTNPLYNPGETTLPEQVLDRCIVCHEDRKFVTSWYRHTSRRIKEIKRSSEEIVTLCASCHGDKRLLARHIKAAQAAGRQLGRKYPYAVDSYEESFHGKVTKYGFTRAADCLDCHVNNDNYFLNVHDIRPSRDPESPVNDANRAATCRRCHTFADERYAAIDPHPTSNPTDSPFRYMAERIYNAMSVAVMTFLIGLAMFETLGRRRDGVGWQLRNGSSWQRKSRRGRERIV